MAEYSDCLTCAAERRPDPPPREQVYLDPHWRAAHAFGTAQPGWLVVLPRHAGLDRELRGPRIFALPGGDPARHVPDSDMDQLARRPAAALPAGL